MSDGYATIVVENGRYFLMANVPMWGAYELAQAMGDDANGYRWQSTVSPRTGRKSYATAIIALGAAADALGWRLRNA